MSRQHTHKGEYTSLLEVYSSVEQHLSSKSEALGSPTASPNNMYP